MIYEKLIANVRFPNEAAAEWDKRISYNERIEHLNFEIIWATDETRAKFRRTLAELERLWAEKKLKISRKVIVNEFERTEAGIFCYCTVDEIQENKLSGKPKLLTLAENGKEYKIIEAKPMNATGKPTFQLRIDAEEMPILLMPQAALVSFWAHSM